MTTDHIKIWTNDSEYIGLVVKPFTYRVNFAPDFFPRFSIGDVSGLDQTRWRSWVQSRFDEGEGQLLWSSAEATSRYAIGHLVEVNRPMGGPVHYGSTGAMGHNFVNAGASGRREDSIVGDLSVALFPAATSMGTKRVLFNSGIGNPAVLFTDSFPSFVLDWSGRPSIWHWKTGWWYTDVSDPVAWSGGSMQSYSNRLTGKWEMLWQHSDAQISSMGKDDFYISSAVNFSGTIHLALKEPNGIHRMLAFGPMSGTQTVGGEVQIKPTASTMYMPVYATVAAKLAVYDEKLWFSRGGGINYLEPAAGTMPARWEPLQPGSPDDEVLNMREFNGRLYIGKPNALWTFDAGRLYRVEDFSSYEDYYNFSHMTVHRGYMYFNIRHMLFRLSTAGTIEQVQTYPTAGVIQDAASVGDKLYYLMRHPGGENVTTSVWVFDPESGGNFRSFACNAIGLPEWASPRSMGTSHGMLFMMPMTHTEQYSATNVTQGYPLNIPVAVLDPVIDGAQKTFSGYALRNSYMITSMLDFGLPTLQKSFRRLTVDYELSGWANEYIDIYYITELEKHRTILTSVEVQELISGPTVWGTVDDTLNDDNLATGKTWTWDNRGAANSYESWVVGIKAPDGSTAGEQCTREDIRTLRFIGKWNTQNGHKFNLADFIPYIWRGSWVSIRAQCTIKGSYIAGIHPGDAYYVVIEVKINNDDLLWTQDNLATVSAAAKTDTRGLRSWFALRTIYDFPGDFEGREVILSNALNDSPTYISNLNWTYLGRIGGYTDITESEVHKTRKSLNFPNGFSGNQIMLKFVLQGLRWSAPIIRRYEVEWMPTPTRYKIYNFVVPVAENIELPNLEIRANATSVVATVFSLSMAGRSYVCQMPWPGTHTINGLISITSPGGVVPSLRDNDFDNSYSDIPMQIDQV